MKTKAPKRNSPSTPRPCPACDKLVPSTLLVCDCGYHFQTKRRIAQGDDALESREAARERHEEDMALDYPWLSRCAPLFNIFAYLALGAAAIRLIATLLPYYYLLQMGTTQSIVSIALVGDIVLICAVGVISFVTLRGLSDAARLWLATAAGISNLMDDENPTRSRSKE